MQRTFYSIVHGCAGRELCGHWSGNGQPQIAVEAAAKSRPCLGLFWILQSNDNCIRHIWCLLESPDSEVRLRTRQVLATELIILAQSRRSAKLDAHTSPHLTFTTS
jgi:hypothetical protein